IAVLLVLGRHFYPSKGVNPILLTWQRGGWIGVDLFFVLSGFLVSGLLFDEHLRQKKLSINTFLLRRGLKIYPAFWVLIIVTIFVNSTQNLPTPTKGLIGELLFLQNYLAALWNHTWSLAVEEHFYLGLALLLFLLHKKRALSNFSEIP